MKENKDKKLDAVLSSFKLSVMTAWHAALEMGLHAVFLDMQVLSFCSYVFTRKTHSALLFDATSN